MTRDRTYEFKRNLELIGNFRAHLRALGDEKMLILLRSLESEAFSNSEVRPALGVKRKAVWKRLAKLVGLGLIEKRGYSYRVTDSANSLVGSLALALRSTVTGRSVVMDASLIEAVTKIGPDIVEWAYAKGRIDRPEYLKYTKELAELEARQPRDAVQQ